MSNTFFTSDHHFDHTNIIKYSKRPYRSIGEMNEDLIRRWNEVVGDDDVVYHLGDFTLGDTSVAKRFFAQLNGDIRYVKGSHDKWDYGRPHLLTKSSKPVVYLGSLYEVYAIDPSLNPIVLCHYAMLRWNHSHHGAFHLFGHSHGNLEKPAPRSMDVGVDCTNLTPITFQQILEHIGNQEPSENHPKRG